MVYHGRGRRGRVDFQKSIFIKLFQSPSLARRGFLFFYKKIGLPKNFPYSQNMDMVRVVWLDTNECSLSAWQDKQELLESEPCTISSLGYLVRDDEKCITISADKDDFDKDDLYGRSQVIPKGVVLKVERLKIDS